MTWVVKRSEEYLVHFGIPGMKWGERRFQNEDGTLTPAGKERYGVGMRALHRIAAPNRLSGARRIDKASQRAFGGIKASRAARYKQKAADAKGLRKAFYEQHAKNNYAMASYHNAAANSSLGKRVFNSLVYNHDLATTPYYRMSGRETTVGMNMLENILGVSLLADAAYLLDKKKDNK